MHAEQALQALRRRTAVFCQKPLGRTEKETCEVIDAAEAEDRLLGVDLSYRYINGMEIARELVQSGQLGNIFLVDLVFHNAYGPDKDWFYDFSRSGGGCLIDLGTHLIDLAQWVLGNSDYRDLRSMLWENGKSEHREKDGVEGAATAEWLIPSPSAQQGKVRLACSWNLHAGMDAVIEARFYGTDGAVVLRNVDGSFYDFVLEHHIGTRRQPLAEPDSSWGGRALVRWIQQLSKSPCFDPEIQQLVHVARIIDEVYQR